ncbi:Cd2+/Zn2+-exporting ATPase [Fodinibius roseus]|uniref:Cd2+/Zn2+-exporting ATPase n=1 Tax=Fodinibius roseus TaxID=1194090 RepID=A0A1M4X9Q0_9BACT|nr:heavy metal translocating P-type ATPase [Fodinibius roseus]SHE90227.1 Cd2+/Zn2+-exporting ATPase [Fodinibius roseus]
MKKILTAGKFKAWLTVICAIALLIGAIGEWTGWLQKQLTVVFYIIAYLSGGYAGTVESIRALTKFKINVDVLMILAALGAASIGEWMEGAILLFLFSLSNTLQDYALGKSRREIKSLMKLRPDEALVRNSDGSEIKRPVEELSKGDIVIVRPGERIPIDGEITDGITSVNQAAITGESVPVKKKPGDEVFAASLNENGVISVRVTKLAKETTLAKIIRMVEQAQGSKAATQRFLDDFEPWYAVGVISAVVLLILFPWFFSGQPFDDIFYRAMTVLVVASPCALVISTPASVLSAIANAAKNGILFKGGAYLEQAASIDIIAFDKTGTLTKGNLAVTDIIPYNNGKAGQISESELLSMAASAEEHSEHHLAAAILKKAGEQKVAYGSANQVQSEAGKGISAQLKNKTIQVGNEKLFDTTSEDWKNGIREEADKLKLQAKTVIYVVIDGKPAGIIAVADEIREQAPAAIKKLKSLQINRLLMLTGDTTGVARSIADEITIDEFHAELLPDEKVEFIKQLVKEGSTAMVGDGVNDAPALAASHMGIAMGTAGTDVALETADVVLMGDDLNKLPYLIQLARKSRKIVWQNIIFSLAVIAVLVASVFLFALPLPIGVVGHEGSTLLVVLNGLRLLRT